MLGVCELKQLLIEHADLSALEIKEKLLARAIEFCRRPGQRRRPDLRGHEGPLTWTSWKKNWDTASRTANCCARP